jgi:glycosyltransferase involved in cell wall biosynthesis
MNDRSEPSAEPVDLSVVVLGYRSAAVLPSFIRSLVGHLEREVPSWEIVLVGNYVEGSGDPTPSVVRELADADPRIRPVVKAKEGMMGWDMTSGLEAATGKVIAVIDGDGQMPEEDVVRVWRHLVDHDLDMAKTYREQRDDGAYRRTISYVFNRLFRVLFPGLRSRDVNSKPKILRRWVYDNLDLTSTGWFIDTEMMIQVRRMNVKLGEIPTVFRANEKRPSFVKPLAILEFVGNMIRYRIREFGGEARRRKGARRP